VWYRDEVDTRPHFVDVKYRDDIFAHWKELKPRLRAAAAHSRSRAAVYEIVTEVEIRTEFLDNAKRFLPLRREAPHPDDKEQLLELACRLDGLTPRQLIAACEPNEERRARLTRSLWCLIAHGELTTDFARRLHMDSIIWRRFAS
jgi:hypothetical protein